MKLLPFDQYLELAKTAFPEAFQAINPYKIEDWKRRRATDAVVTHLQRYIRQQTQTSEDLRGLNSLQFQQFLYEKIGEDNKPKATRKYRNSEEARQANAAMRMANGGVKPTEKFDSLDAAQDCSRNRRMNAYAGNSAAGYRADSSRPPSTYADAPEWLINSPM